jgi:hypothetical protein
MSSILNNDPTYMAIQKASSVSLRAEPQRGKRSPEGMAMPQSHFSIIVADCFGIKRLAMTFPFLFVHPPMRES